MISFSCESCGHEYKVPNEYAGKKARCKKCNFSIRIPSKMDAVTTVNLNQAQEPLPLSVQQYTLKDEQPPEHSVDQIEYFPEEYKEILIEIDRQEKKKTSSKGNVAILLITLIVFFHLGLFRNGLGYILAIIVVLFLHEAGHLIGMRVFGYRNLQMFFIPFLGAAA